MINPEYETSDPYCAESFKCHSNPCQHNSTCVDTLDRATSKSTYKCTCTEDYTGYTCDLAIDYCASAPCQHNSTCMSDIGRYECQCTKGELGIHCDVIIAACDLNNICGMYGNCVNTLNGYLCTCDTG